MEHLADELDQRGFVGVLLLELHDESEGAVLERCVGRAYNDGVPISPSVTHPMYSTGSSEGTYHCITLSATGDADTPAGGSVCIRWGGGGELVRAHTTNLIEGLLTLKSRIKRRRAAVDISVLRLQLSLEAG